MASSKWTKRNNTILYTGIAISVVFLGVVGQLFDALRPGQNVWVMVLLMVVTIGGFVLTFSLAKRNPSLMSRVLKLEYAAADFALRKTFKDKHIPFHRQQDDDGLHLFEFPGNGLETRIHPYDPLHGTKGTSGKVSSLGMSMSATLITVQGLNSKNQKFAELLAESIDQMVEQQMSEARLT